MLTVKKTMLDHCAAINHLVSINERSLCKKRDTSPSLFNQFGHEYPKRLSNYSTKV